MTNLDSPMIAQSINRLAKALHRATWEATVFQLQVEGKFPIDRTPEEFIGTREYHRWAWEIACSICKDEALAQR